VKINLEPNTHTYTSESGIKYKSVSALIEQFVPFFDFEQKSYEYSLKYGLPVEEVRLNWREKNKKSTVFGHKIHSNIEKLLTENKTEHSETIYDQILKEVSKFNTKGAKFLTEQIVYSEEYKVAGTSDLIVQRKLDFDIIDFKTNKKIKIDNPYNESLTYPVQHLPNSEFFKYALQLSLYALMNEALTGNRAYRLIMFWFKRKNSEDYESLNGTWVKYSVPFLKEEAKLILDYGASR